VTISQSLVNHFLHQSSLHHNGLVWTGTTVDSFVAEQMHRCWDRSHRRVCQRNLVRMPKGLEVGKYEPQRPAYHQLQE
jgi:hypothetical protein